MTDLEQHDRLAAAPESPITGWPRDTRGEFLVGGLPLSLAVARVGQTPCYLYDRGRISARVADLKALLPESVELHYAIKANPMPAVVGLLARLVDGFDVASGGELNLALDAGMAPDLVSFAGPGKSETELTQAVAAGVLVNLESFREVRLLAAIGQRLGRPPRLAVRVNPPFELRASGMKMSGGPKQFGVDAEQVPALLEQIAAAGLSCEGFHFFPGSQNLRPAAIVEAQQQSYRLACELAALLPQPLRSLNLGGGFGIPYFAQDRPLPLGPVADQLHTLAAAIQTDLPGARLIIELGRYLVGEAGLYVARVLDRKLSRGQVFLVTDGGMHHHLAASGNFGQVIRKNYPVAINGRDEPLEAASVVGPLCTPLDLLADQAALARAEPGDLVIVFQSGAYGRSASPRQFLGHPDVPEALL